MKILRLMASPNLYASPWGERVMHQIFREAEFSEACPEERKRSSEKRGR